MEENQNKQPEDNQNAEPQTDQGSVFLTQIQEKRAQYEDKNQKQSVFQKFTQPNPNKKGQDDQKDKPKKGVPILGILGGVAVLFLIFIVLMVAVVAMGGENNALLVSFGVDEARMKDVLLFIVNGSFGFVAFVILLVFVISMFRVSILKKEEKQKRKSILKQLFISLGFLTFILAIWFGTWRIVNGIKLNIPLSQLEIQTNPSELKDLVAPVEIEFDTSEILSALVERGTMPETISWDFDADGEYEVLSEEKTIKHRFEQEGDINVGLLVNLSDGQTQSFYKLVEITKAEFIATPERGRAPLKVAFDASRLERTDTPAASFEWDFDGDGTYDDKQTSATAEYTFEKIGVYNVGLRIVDIHNNFRTYSKKIEVAQDTVNSLSAKIQVSPSLQGIIPFKVNLSGVESSPLDDITEYEWDFGDGTAKQSGRVVSYTYKTPGTYNVTLVVYDENGEKDSDEVKIEVEKNASSPVAIIKIDPLVVNEQGVLEGVIPLTVNFDASLSEDEDDNIVEYAWDLDGDGEFDEYGEKIDYTFETEGKHNVILKVTDSDEQSSEASMVVESKTQELQAILLADPISGSLPLKVNFDASTSVNKKGDIVTYEWDFGDNSGAEYGDAKRTHIYDREGRYTVKIKVIADDGKTAETSKDIFVRALQLQACFSNSPETGTAPFTVEFDASCSQGEVAKWKWDFGDGFISTSHSPTHTFKQKGEYTVSLELIDEKNNSSNYQSTIVVQ